MVLDDVRDRRSVDFSATISRSIPVYWTRHRRRLMYLKCQIRILNDNDIRHIKASLDFTYEYSECHLKNARDIV